MHNLRLPHSNKLLIYNIIIGFIDIKPIIIIYVCIMMYEVILGMENTNLYQKFRSVASHKILLYLISTLFQNSVQTSRYSTYNITI